MKQYPILTSPLFSRIGAVLLLLIFLSVPLLEAFHHHFNRNKEEAYGLSAKLTKSSSFKKSTASFSSFVEKCELCEMMKHHAHHFYLPAQHYAVFISQPLPEQRWFFLLQSSAAFINRSANKGPPIG